MNIYERGGTKNSPPKCSYCRNPNHKARECDQAPKDWEYWKNKQVPPYAPAVNWWTQPRYWGEWYTKCAKTMDTIERYQAQQALPKAKRKPVSRSCGFCGSKHHTRRNCDKMQDFLADCYTANANWRRKAYEVLVQKHGIYVGSAVKVKKTSTYGVGAQNAVALVTDVNFDKLNLFCANARWGDYSQRLHVAVNVNGQRQLLQFYHNSYYNRNDNPTPLEQEFETVFKDTGHGQYSFDGVVTNGSTPLDPSWVTDYRDAFDWLVKKRSYDRLKEEGIVKTVEHWKNVS